MAEKTNHFETSEFVTSFYTFLNLKRIVKETHSTKLVYGIYTVSCFNVKTDQSIYFKIKMDEVISGIFEGRPLLVNL